MEFLRYMVTAPPRQRALGRRGNMRIVSMSNTAKAVLRLIVLALEVSGFLK